jgi:hypothetical protein
MAGNPIGLSWCDYGVYRTSVLLGIITVSLGYRLLSLQSLASLE